eukprot:gene13022-3484_t
MFKEDDLRKKMRVLSSSQPSIQTLSLWLMHYREHAEVSVRIWLEEFIEAPVKRKLSLFYLANDALLQSRKKGPEIAAAFRARLPDAVSNAASSGDKKMLKSIDRMINIWGDRAAFPDNYLDDLRMKLIPDTAALAGTRGCAGWQTLACPQVTSSVTST